MSTFPSFSIYKGVLENIGVFHSLGGLYIGSVNIHPTTGNTITNMHKVAFNVLSNNLNKVFKSDKNCFSLHPIPLATFYQVA